VARTLLKIHPPMASETGLWHGAGRLTLEEEVVEAELLSSVLNRLNDRYAARFREALFDAETGQIKRSVVVLRNSRLVFGADRLVHIG
jgi:hypothetical protein